MKVKTQKHSVFFKGMILAMAVALTVLCLPFNGIVALAKMSAYTDYTYMTIGSVDEEVSTTVVTGDKFYVPNAYIGGDKAFTVGKTPASTAMGSATYVSSKITVKYNALTLTDVDSTTVNAETDITNKVVVTAAEDEYGYFVANKVGTYTITYSYTYEVEANKYTNSYELKVDSQLSKVSMNFANNEKNFVPERIDLALAKDGETFKDLYLPTPEVVDEDNEVIDGVKFYTAEPATKTGAYVVISARGGTEQGSVAVSENAGQFYIDGDVFKTKGAEKYTITYKYYYNGEFIAYTEKSTDVYAVGNEYYKDYKKENLVLELEKDWVDNGQTGVETELPKAKVTTSDKVNKAGEKVDIYYTVKVLYKGEDGFEPITVADYTAEVVNTDGTLVNPNAFKPLKDGSYRFVYTAYDFYGNKLESSEATYEYKNITDKKEPVAIIYDAAVGQEESAVTKLQTRARPNSVIVYAIGIDDNVSKEGDNGVELTREIRTSSTTVLSVKGYNNYNLVFNYRKTSTTPAYTALLNNNYLIRKQVPATIVSDAQMLVWLRENNYAIVVDNANAAHIYEIFKDSGVFAAGTTAENALDWFKSCDVATTGFAYIDTDKTFGATTSDAGTGSNQQYYIHYIAKDAAGITGDTVMQMYVGTYEDYESPTLKFGTTLSDSYLPTATVTFNAPTATDNYDSRVDGMIVRTMYRYLDSTNNVVAVEGKTELENLTALWGDLGTGSEGKKDDKGILFTTKYAEFHNGDNDGYIEITDEKASSYSINLKEAGATATKLQIVSYVYDDNGNASIYAEEVAIKNINDTTPPQFVELNDRSDLAFNNTYEAGKTIALPQMKVKDDAVDYMGYDVKVFYLGRDGEEGVREEVNIFGAGRETTMLPGTYVLNAGNFVAAIDGNYQAVIKAYDSNNNTVVSFVNYKVTPVVLVQEPSISTTLTDKTVERGEVVELPAPTVNYNIADSVTYDQYSQNPANYADKDFVILGVNKNGKAADGMWSTELGTHSFVADKVDTHNIKYTVNFIAYNKNTFTYVPQAYVSGNYVDAHFLFGADVKVTPVEANKFVANVGAATVVITKAEDGTVSLVDAGTGATFNVTGTALDGQNIANWFSDLRVYTKTSKTYSIKVQDTVKPVLNEVEEYVGKAITIEEIEEAGAEGYKLTIHAISSESDDLDTSKCKIELSYKLADGTPWSDSYEGDNAFVDHVYTIKKEDGKKLDGTYSIKYTLYDKSGNTTTKTYDIAVGDNLAPTVSFEDDFIADSYEIGSTLKIDLNDITVKDNKTLTGITPKITLKNISTDKEVEYTEVAGIYEFKLDEVGSYELLVEVEDEAGNKHSEPLKFEVSAKTQDAVKTYQIVGTVLIVVSVLLLAGVVVYFIVSKVKLDKELKKK